MTLDDERSALDQLGELLDDRIGKATGKGDRCCQRKLSEAAVIGRL